MIYLFPFKIPCMFVSLKIVVQFVRANIKAYESYETEGVEST